MLSLWLIAAQIAQILRNITSNTYYNNTCACVRV